MPRGPQCSASRTPPWMHRRARPQSPARALAEPLRGLSLLQGLAALLPPASILTALAVWYGYELVRTRGRYFGLDPSVLDYTTREYVLRSASAVLAPLLYLTVGCLALLWVHAVLREVLRRRMWAGGIGALGILFTIIGAAATVQGVRIVADRTVLAEAQSIRPLVLAAGVILAAYGPWLFRQSHGREAAQSASLLFVTTCALTIATVALSLFWSFSVAAASAGLADSHRLASNQLRDLPRVIVYSAEALALSGPGVEGERMPGQSTYPWRYTGLRLLVRSSDQYFLLPTGWVSRDDVAIVLRDSKTLRFEFQEPERL